MSQDTIEEEILRLITLGYEGDYWDFKEKHHENNAELLHDILCLANSISKHDKYLIFGVSDPSDGCKVIGVKAENRKTQAELIDFLRSKKFAQGNRPQVSLQTISLYGKELDVIVVADRSKKPYYLEDTYRDGSRNVLPHHIYTRVLDTNTPINQSAHYEQISDMWRERFGLDLEPAERIIELLKNPDEWNEGFGDETYYYHRNHPEYRIVMGECFDNDEVYRFFYINPTSLGGDSSFYFHGTKLFTLSYVYCDETRVKIARPNLTSLRQGARELWYMFYELDSRNGAFLEFLLSYQNGFHSRDHEAYFPIFESSRQRKLFESYLLENINELDAIPPSGSAELVARRIKEAKTQYIFDPVEMKKIHDLFWKWNSFN